MSRTSWPTILNEAASIVESYDTLVTLRQLFYRLVAALLLPNTDTSYKTLSSRTAAARRAGTFPELVDRTRQIHEPDTFADPADALQVLADQYRRDRTGGQQWSIYLSVEKRGLVQQLRSWFGEQGLPVVELGGYCGQAHVDRVRGHVRVQNRPAVLLYAGDFDPSGEDIDRDFIARTDCWAKVERVALNAGQVEQYQLPPQPGKATDSRAAGFVARHGELMQVEVDALPPDTLRELFTDAVDAYWDMSTYEHVQREEADERSELADLARRWSR